MPDTVKTTKATYSTTNNSTTYTVYHAEEGSPRTYILLEARCEKCGRALPLKRRAIMINDRKISRFGETVSADGTARYTGRKGRPTWNCADGCRGAKSDPPAGAPESVAAGTESAKGSQETPDSPEPTVDSSNPFVTLVADLEPVAADKQYSDDFVVQAALAAMKLIKGE